MPDVRLTSFTYDNETGLSEFHRYGADYYGLHQTHEGATDDPAAIAALCANRYPSHLLPNCFRVLKGAKALAKQHERYYR